MPIIQRYENGRGVMCNLFWCIAGVRSVLESLDRSVMGSSMGLDSPLEGERLLKYCREQHHGLIFFFFYNCEFEFFFFTDVEQLYFGMVCSVAEFSHLSLCNTGKITHCARICFKRAFTMLYVLESDVLFSSISP